MIRVMLWLFGTPIAVAAMIAGATLSPIEQAAVALHKVGTEQLRQ